jgi:hypothetical protein
MRNSTRKRPSWRHEGYKDMDSCNATRTCRHSRASLVPILWEIKKSLSELCMMDWVRMLSGGSVGVEYVGAEGGGPVYMMGWVEILSPER